ncbi:MAG: hypothetical protein ABW321_09455 [Polyangiales bacterium]
MQPSRVWLLSIWLAVVISAPGTGVLAAPPVDASNRAYDDAIRHAVEEYSLGHWAEAKVFFARAHAANPNARTLRGLGLTCYESRSYVEAIGYFEQALSNNNQPLTASMRSDVGQLLEQAKQFVTRVHLELVPRDAKLEVDQRSVVPNADGIVLLDPGTHELAVEAEGYEPERRGLHAEGGDLSLHFALRSRAPLATAAPLVEPAPLAAVTAPTPKPEPESSIAPWIVIGASSAVAIAGGVFVGVAMADKSAVEDPGAEPVWRDDLEDRYDRARTFFPIGFVMLGVGLAGVATGVTWKLWPREHEREHAQLRLTPGHIALSGQF